MNAEGRASPPTGRHTWPLQWSRVRMNAEGWGWTPPGLEYVSFNGAAFG